MFRLNYTKYKNTMESVQDAFPLIKKAADAADKTSDIADKLIDEGVEGVTNVGNITEKLDTNNIPNMTRQDKYTK